MWYVRNGMRDKEGMVASRTSQTSHHEPRPVEQYPLAQLPAPAGLFDPPNDPQSFVGPNRCRSQVRIRYIEYNLTIPEALA
jgi:hypothetical protein